MGYLFAVLPRHFLIHVPHPRSGSKKEWLNSYQTHSAVDTLYTKFLKEIDARYGAATRVHTVFASGWGFPTREADGGPELKITLKFSIRQPPSRWAFFSRVHHARRGTQQRFRARDGPGVHRRELDGQRRLVEETTDAAPSTPAAAIQSPPPLRRRHRTKVSLAYAAGAAGGGGGHALPLEIALDGAHRLERGAYGVARAATV